jgi:hypothetical protein
VDRAALGRWDASGALWRPEAASVALGVTGGARKERRPPSARDKLAAAAVDALERCASGGGADDRPDAVLVVDAAPGLLDRRKKKSERSLAEVSEPTEVTDGAGEGLRLPLRELVIGGRRRDALPSPPRLNLDACGGGLGGNMAMLASDRSSSDI